MSSSETTIITYGTFDLFHIGHLNLLKECKNLGTRLVVGVSTDDFNALKGKNTIVPYLERASIVSSIKYVDEVFAEENWDQKPADIQHYNASILAMGDDWKDKFDFLSIHCKIVYFPRTPGISSSSLKETLRILHAIDESRS